MLSQQRYEIKSLNAFHKMNYVGQETLNRQHCYPQLHFGSPSIEATFPMFAFWGEGGWFSKCFLMRTSDLTDENT